MPRNRRRAPTRKAFAIATTGVVLLAACSGGGDGPAPTEAVEDQLGFDQAGMIERRSRAENLVRDCMTAQGFDYVPVDPVAQQAALTGVSGLGEEDFENQYGYGITTLYEERWREQATGGPNEQIRAALSDQDRSAWDHALLGDNLDATFDLALDTGDFGRLGGCTRRAAEQVFGGPAVLETLIGKLDELDERIVADPRMVAAIKQWSECMRVAGYDLGDPDEVDVILQRRLEEIVGPLDTPPALDAAGQPIYDRAALEALQRDEVAMVGADIACEQRHITAVEDEVRAEYERAFRDENANLLGKVPPP